MNIRKDNTPFRPPKPRAGLGIATCGAWIAGLALAALVVSPAVLHAAVIDDFDGDQPKWDGWNPPAALSDPAALAELVSHRLRIATQFTTATDPANPMGHFCDVYCATDILMQQGKTIELRADLVSVSLANNLFACLVTMDTQGGEYVLMWTRTEVALLKWSQSDGFSVAFWETHSGAYLDVVLALALTPDGDDLLIEAKVSRRVNGESVYQRTVRDTLASDWGVPDPLPHGWQIFGPDVGAPYRDDLKVVGLGVLHDTDGQQATAVVQFDNLEYWTLVPSAPEVIDDYEDGRKFSWRHEFFDHTDYAITDGQLNVRLTTTRSAVSFVYTHLFELPEYEPVEFSVDLVSANRASASGGLGVGFPFEVLPPGADRAYALIVRHDLVVFYKSWEGQTAMYSWQELASDSRPKTISLTLTRQGANLRIAGKVVLRDDPQTVLFSQVRVDTPQADISGDPGPPPAGPVWLVGMPCSSSSPISGAEMVFDNLICSRGAAPSLLGIHRQGATAASLVWPEGKCVLESDSLEGPWRPCPEPMSLGEGAYTCTVPLGDSARYFRLDRGFCYFDSFDKPYSHSGVAWATTAVVPGGTPKPTWTRLGPGRNRILGEGTGNTDFMLRWDSPHWYRDCVGTVDIIDWGDTMEDATFGIVLRARPETEMWFANTAGLPEERYAGLLTFKKADNPSESVLSITGPAGAVLKEQRFPAVNPDKEYRLRFWAVGDQLTLELFDKGNLEAPIQTINVTDGRIQAGMHSLYGTKSAGGTYEVWIDQDSLNGTITY